VAMTSPAGSRWPPAEPPSPDLQIEPAPAKSQRYDEEVDAARRVSIASLGLVGLQFFYLAADSQYPQPTAASLINVHLFNVVALSAMTVVLWNASVARYWRTLALLESAEFLIASTVAATLRNSQWSQIPTLALFSLGTAMILPWGIYWQAALNLLCLAAFGILTAIIPPEDLYTTHRWLTLTSTIGLSQLTAYFAARYRRRLRRNEEQIRSVLDSAIDGVIVIDSRGLVSEWNAQALNLFGWNPQETAGRQLAELIMPRRDRGTCETLLRRAQSGELLRKRIEITAAHRGGIEFPAEIVLSPIVLRGEERLSVFVRDISDRKRADETRALLAAIFESTDEAMLSIDLSGKATSWNPAAERLLGYKADEIVGADTAVMVPPKRRAEVAELGERMRREPRLRRVETERLRKDGTPVPVSISHSPIYDSAGALIGISIVARDLTERKRAQSAQALLAAIVESSADALYSARAGNLTSWNPGAERMYGYQADEVIGKSALILWPREQHDQLRGIMRRIDREQIVREHESTRVRKDGSTFEVAVTASPMHDNRGRVIGASVAERDITASKKAARDLAENEEKFRKIFNGSLDAISISTINDGRYLDVNDETLRFSGFRREEMIGKTTEELGIWVHNDTPIRIRKGLLRDGVIRNLEIETRTKDGSIRSGLLSAQIAEIGGQKSVIAFSRDITERRVAERTLAENEAKFRKIFNDSLDAIAIMSLPEGRYIDMNDEYCALTGFSREETRDQTPAGLGLMTDERLGQGLAQMLAEGVVRNRELEIKSRDGQVRSVLYSTSPIELAGRDCYMVFARDVTELKQAERAVIDAAVKASQAKSDFLSAMSHEIRTPLNAIIGMADLLWDTPLTNEQREYVRIFRSTGNTLQNLINEILDLSKVEAGRLALEAVGFDLDELIDKVGETLAVSAQSKGLELICDIAPDVPVDLIGDPLRIRQVLINLIGNAIKFTEKGHVVVAVEREPGSAKAGALRLSVSDTGVGITQEQQAVLFGRFAQADVSTARKYGGSGLGLSICKALIELMGGRFWLESTPGSGTTFFVSIVLDTQSPRGRTLAVSTRLSGLKVLVVESDSAARQAVSRTLCAHGALVDALASSQKALEELMGGARAADYELILVDSRMPAIDGFTICQRSTAAGRVRGRMVLLLNADNLAGDLAHVKESGASDYLFKPLRRSALVELALSIRAPRLVGQIDKPAADSVKPRRVFRILLAEDSPDNRLLIQAYLKKTLYTLDTAANGQVAFEMFTAAQYDLVLMDMQMPQVDGYVATAKIREWEKQKGAARTPIIALTAFALPADVQRSVAAGCDGHLSKPIRKKLLLDEIEKYIAQPDRAAGFGQNTESAMLVKSS